METKFEERAFAMLKKAAGFEETPVGAQAKADARKAVRQTVEEGNVEERRALAMIAEGDVDGGLQLLSDLASAAAVAHVVDVVAPILGCDVVYADLELGVVDAEDIEGGAPGPRIQHDQMNKVCEIPNVVASCPTAAIRPADVDGNPSVEIEEELCMFCANCFSVCPALPMADSLNDGISLWVGGKVSNARSEPMFSKLAVPFIENEPPRWPTTVKTIRNMVEVWADGARKYERMGEFIERIGWPKFFELTGIEFEKEHIDDYKYAGLSFKRSAQLRHVRH